MVYNPGHYLCISISLCNYNYPINYNGNFQINHSSSPGRCSNEQWWNRCAEYEFHGGNTDVWILINLLGSNWLSLVWYLCPPCYNKGPAPSPSTTPIGGAGNCPKTGIPSDIVAQRQNALANGNSYRSQHSAQPLTVDTNVCNFLKFVFEDA